MCRFHPRCAHLEDVASQDSDRAPIGPHDCGRLGLPADEDRAQAVWDHSYWSPWGVQHGPVETPQRMHGKNLRPPQVALPHHAERHRPPTRCSPGRNKYMYCCCTTDLLKTCLLNDYYQSSFTEYFAELSIRAKCCTIRHFRNSQQHYINLPRWSLLPA